MRAGVHISVTVLSPSCQFNKRTPMLQDEKNQIITTNCWLNQVNIIWEIGASCSKCKL